MELGSLFLFAFYRFFIQLVSVLDNGVSQGG